MLSPTLVPVIELIPPEEWQKMRCSTRHSWSCSFNRFVWAEQATAPCLVLVGSMMMGPARHLASAQLCLTDQRESENESCAAVPDRGQRHRLWGLATGPASLPDYLHHSACVTHADLSPLGGRDIACLARRYSISAGIFVGIASYYVLGCVLWLAEAAAPAFLPASLFLPFRRPKNKPLVLPSLTAKASQQG